MPFPRLAAAVQIVGDVLIFGGKEMAEGEIFQRPFELPDAEAAGQRREESHRFLCRQLSRRVVRLAAAEGDYSLGQLQHGDAGIVDERQQQLPGVIRLRLGFAGEDGRIMQCEDIRGSQTEHGLHQRGDRRRQGVRL